MRTFIDHVRSLWCLMTTASEAKLKHLQSKPEESPRAQLGRSHFRWQIRLRSLVYDAKGSMNPSCPSKSTNPTWFSPLPCSRAEYQKLTGKTKLRGERVRVTKRTRPAGTCKAQFSKTCFRMRGFRACSWPRGFAMMVICPSPFLEDLRYWLIWYGYHSWLKWGVCGRWEGFILIVGFIANKAFVPAKPTALKRLEQE